MIVVASNNPTLVPSLSCSVVAVVTGRVGSLQWGTDGVVPAQSNPHHPPCKCIPLGEVVCHMLVPIECSETRHGRLRVAADPTVSAVPQRQQPWTHAMNYPYPEPTRV